MAGFLQKGQQWLAKQRLKADGVDVVYRRGDQSLTVTAVLGSSLLKTSDRQGNVKVERTDRDFIVPADALDFGEGPTVPQRDDRVDLAVGATTTRYRVLPVEGEPAWRHTDEFGTAFRIHAKFEQVVMGG